MGYIDKESLLELLKNTENEERRYILNYLITSYMFDGQWQTIDEFKKNPVEGWCFICFSGHSRDMAYYFKDEKEFHDRDDSGHSVAARNITHVMPIKTPEAPK